MPCSFGFIHFSTAEEAKAAVEAKRGTELDGRALNIDFDGPRKDRGDGGAKNGNTRDRADNRAKQFGDQKGTPCNSLWVGNISFDATAEMIGEAFGEYGSVTRVSLPTDRETGSPKGYGYVDFSSVDEAKQAMEHLNGSDIMGRSIRLDYATPRTTDGFPSAGGRGARGGGRGDRGGRGSFGGDRGGRGGRGGRGDRGGGRGGSRGGRGGTTNRGGLGDFKGSKVTF